MHLILFHSQEIILICIFPAFNIISKTIPKLEAEKKSPPFSTTSPAIENAKLVPKSTALPISKCQILTDSKILQTIPHIHPL